MIVPSVDLMDGRVVQLVSGKRLAYRWDDVMHFVREFGRYGEIAVIDLDAAMGKGDNRDLVKEILKSAECRVGGGIRSIEDARELVSLGAKKVIVGSKAFENGRVNHAFLAGMSGAIGKERTIVAIDAWGKEILCGGWRKKTGLDLFDVIAELERHSCGLLYTCVEKEGGLLGIDMGMVERIRESTLCHTTVAGGIGSIEEVRKLSEMGVDVQLGMSIYTKRIDLREAFIESLDWKKGLLPTITQDPCGQVLMIGYSSRESLKKTLREGRMWYFSRSKNRLWMKGESSGNIQELKRIRPDCDGDALLATVNQKNCACHTGFYSCFGDRRFSLRELFEVVKDRIDHPDPQSYTSRLSDETIRGKISEEAHEVAEARSREEILWEVSDILYFLTVFLAKNEVGIEEVFHELGRRRKK